MIDENGKFTQLTLIDALQITLAEAEAAGVEVTTGSVEEQINAWLAQSLVEYDSALYASYVKQFNPTGSDIDIQNPGSPRLQATSATGYLSLANATGSPITVTAGSIFTAPNGNTYSTGLNFVTVGAGSTGFIAISSVATGSAQNLPAGQSFTSSYTLAATNPQPFVDGIDTETDPQYISRLIYLRTNNTSEQATPAAEKELLDAYAAARIYVNNSQSNLTAPVPIPAAGYNPVVLFPSGVTAGAEEIQTAINIFASRFEFGNVLAPAFGTSLHPLLSAVIYTGTFPQRYTVTPAQAVATTINAVVTVSFPSGTDSSEKALLAEAFGAQFVQNLIDFYGGAAGTFTMEFQEAGSPTPSLVTTTPAVLAGGAVTIAPVVSIEQIRAFISDQNETIQGLNYLACGTLTAELNPDVVGESSVLLSIDAPSGGSVASVDFVQDALFTDSTSWYDRYIFLDPSLITVRVNEV